MGVSLAGAFVAGFGGPGWSERARWPLLWSLSTGAVVVVVGVKDVVVVVLALVPEGLATGSGGSLVGDEWAPRVANATVGCRGGLLACFSGRRRARGALGWVVDEVVEEVVDGSALTARPGGAG